MQPHIRKFSTEFLTEIIWTSGTLQPQFVQVMIGEKSSWQHTIAVPRNWRTEKKTGVAVDVPIQAILCFSLSWRLTIFNRNLLGNCLWRFACERDRLWRKVVCFRHWEGWGAWSDGPHRKYGARVTEEDGNFGSWFCCAWCGTFGEGGKEDILKGMTRRCLKLSYDTRNRSFGQNTRVDTTWVWVRDTYRIRQKISGYGCFGSPMNKKKRDTRETKMRREKWNWTWIGEEQRSRLSA